MWAILDDQLPECLRMHVCPRCAALVPVVAAAIHGAWHIRQERDR